MKRRIGLVLVAGAVVAAMQVSGAGAAPTTPQGNYIVVFNDSVKDPGSVAGEHARGHGAQVRHVYQSALKGYAATVPAGRLNALRNDPRVAYVEEDGVVTTLTTQSSATWGLDRTDQRALPLNSTYNYTRTGLGVRAYIIDTGIRSTHTEIVGRVVGGTDRVDGQLPADDCNGHGTHVAGTVGGATYGVAKAVTLVAVRVLDCNGSGTWSGVIAGIDWVTADHQAGQPAVANMSLGGGASTAVDTAVRNSIADGVTYAIAAGNGNASGIAQDACRYSPARVTQAITVSATDSTDRKASWANYGSCVDLFAPGVSITSAWKDTDTTTRTISGTSMATPHTAGVAALFLQSSPASSPAQVATALATLTTKGVVSSSRTTNNHLLFSNY
jgi:subtilisin family serine protease